MENLHYRYFRNKKGIPLSFLGIESEISQYGGVTLVATIEPLEVRIGFAICSDKEKFHKARGKEFALDRLKNMPVTIKLGDVMSIIGQTSTSDTLNKKAIDRVNATLTFEDFNREFIYSFFMDNLFEEAKNHIMTY